MDNTDDKYSPKAVPPWNEKSVNTEWDRAAKIPVKSLDWSRKYIVTLPPTIFTSDYASKLIKLNLDTNQLEQLPVEFGKLNHLTHLDLSSNRFSTFPLAILDLERLQCLKMERNSLIALPQLSPLKNLTFVSFFGNRIETIPNDCFNEMTALKHVDLALNYIPEMPDSLNHLRSTVENFFLDIEIIEKPPPKQRRAKAAAQPKKKNPPPKKRTKK